MKYSRRINLPDGQGEMFIEQSGDSVRIIRISSRGNVKNYLNKYEVIDDDGDSHILNLNLDVANTILNRIESGHSYSSCYVFHAHGDVVPLEISKSQMEHSYTSTGIKFWRHQSQMWAYKNDKPNSIISTHISPEGKCNLRCPFCSVTYRDTHSRIPLETIQDYVIKLKSRGLKAVILTGGGEPTLYPDFNRLVQWLKYDQCLSVALITNGTQSKRVDEDSWRAFSWVRVSINIFENWEERIYIPHEQLNGDCIVGCSMVFTSEHESCSTNVNDRLDILNRVSKLSSKLNSRYIRLLPNCLLDQKELLLQHAALDKLLSNLNDPRFFHQYKIHGAPRANVCHQSFFRPYLSEEIFHGNGKCGTVFPCDSVVLNNSYQHFSKKYQICHASDILDFLDKKIAMNFSPRDHCSGCVFTQNVNMLEDWKTNGVEKFNEYSIPLEHEEFV